MQTCQKWQVATLSLWERLRDAVTLSTRSRARPGEWGAKCRTRSLDRRTAKSRYLLVADLLWGLSGRSYLSRSVSLPSPCTFVHSFHSFFTVGNCDLFTCLLSFFLNRLWIFKSWDFVSLLTPRSLVPCTISGIYLIFLILTGRKIGRERGRKRGRETSFDWPFFITTLKKK